MTTPLFAGPLIWKKIGPVRSVKLGSFLMESAIVSLFALKDASVAITRILLNAPAARPVTFADQIESELFEIGGAETEDD